MTHRDVAAEVFPFLLRLAFMRKSVSVYAWIIFLFTGVVDKPGAVFIDF